MPQKIELLTRECFDLCDGDINRARLMMKDRIVNDPELVEIYIGATLNQLLLKEKSKRRTEITHAIEHPQNAMPDRGLNGLRLTGQDMLSIYDYPLQGSVVLGNAFAEDVLAQIHTRIPTVKTTLKRLRFEETIYRSIKNNPTIKVSDQLTTNELKQMYREANGSLEVRL
jgi:D-alanine-D-alanine ligase-like ATP-grasp enzyme